MTELRQQLQQSLGTAYRIERELGGGGMSRVFVAEETAFGRRVVVKLLAPELVAGVNFDRFKREIQLAARLQHPHIVPVITAGEAAGLPYYTMPFVDGESLRDRLARGPLAVADALGVLADVAKALAYAHSFGVVHRDIKPDNVLLSHGAAAVADFGIAKALAASQTQPGRVSLTQVGTSIGTPMYMAPEQAAGDPDVDARADIYAFGCMAYELFAGAPPFVSQSPQKLLAAHMSEVPRPVTELRPDTPPPVAALIMRCLAKDPADRPESVTQVLAVLESSSGDRPAASAVKRSWNGTATRTAMAAGGLVLLVGAALTMSALGVGPFATLISAGELERGDAVMVSEFTVNGPDTTLGRVIAEAVKADLAQSRAMAVLEDAKVRQALIDMRQPNTRLLLPVAREVAQRTSAKVVVDGTLQPVGAGFVVTLRIVTADSARELASFTDAADSPSELIQVVGGLTRKLRGKVGESLRAVQASPPLWQVTTASLPALQKYAEGRRALNSGDRAAYDRLLREAVAIDSNFGAAYISLASNNLADASDFAETARLLARVHALRDRLNDRDRWTGEKYFYNFGPVETRDHRLADVYDDSLQLRFTTGSFGALSRNGQALARSQVGDFRGADSLLRIAAHLDPEATYPIANLIAAQLADRRVAAAETTMAAARKRFSPRVVEDLEWLLVVGRGDLVKAESLAVAKIRVAPALARSRALDAGAIAAHQGRLRDARRYWALAPGRVGEAARVARAIVTLNADTAGATRLLEDALKRYPLDSVDDLDRPYPALARAYAALGQPARAREYFDALVKRRLEGEGRFGWTVPVTRAEIAMAEKRWDDAVAAVSGPIRAQCVTCLWLARANAHDGRGNADSAIVWFEKYLAPLALRGAEHGPATRRLGELYDAKGDIPNALKWYNEFISAWKNADPELQPQVADVRQRIARLQQQERRGR